MWTTRRRPENMHEVSPRPIHVIWLYLTRCNQGIANAGTVESLLTRRAQPDRAFDSKQWIWLQSFATVAAGADQRSNIFRPRPKPRVRIVIILVECVLHGPFHAFRCAPYSSRRKIYWKSLRISRLTMRVACTSGRPFPFCASLRELDPRPATFRGRPP